MDFVTTTAGVRLPHVIYGTAWKKEATAPLVTQAITAGFRAIDTACQPRHYREDLVGEGIAAAIASGAVRRDELFIQTKFTPAAGQDMSSIPYDPAMGLPEQVKASCAVSLQNLQIDVIDSLVLHSPLFPYADLLTVWRSMEALVDEGYVRQIGISNLYDLAWHQKLYADARIKPAVIQNRFYADSGYDIDLRHWAKDVGIVYQSFWSLTANPHILEHPVVQGAAISLGKTPAQVFFAFLRTQGVVPLSGTTSQEHMRDDLESAAVTLDAATVNAIAALLAPTKQ